MKGFESATKKVLPLSGNVEDRRTQMPYVTRALLPYGNLLGAITSHWREKLRNTSDLRLMRWIRTENRLETMRFRNGLPRASNQTRLPGESRKARHTRAFQWRNALAKRLHTEGLAAGARFPIFTGNRGSLASNRLAEARFSLQGMASVPDLLDGLPFYPTSKFQVHPGQL